MTELLLELVNVSIPYISVFAIKLYPMWKTRDVKTRSAVIYICCFALCMCASFLFVERFWEVDFRVLQLYKLCIEGPPLIMSFWAFRKRVWQNIFLIATSAMYVTLSIGTGTFVSETWFQTSAYPLLAANIASLAVIAVTLPPLLYLLRRLCENPAMKQAGGIWRVIWILPLSHFGMYLLAGSPFNVSNFQGVRFVFSRILIYFVLMFTCYLLETSLRQVSENISLKESARMTEQLISLQRKQYERITEEARAVKAQRHDLRYQLAAIKGYNNSGEREKLNGYLDELAANIPASDEKTLCENNFAVNAVALQYLSLAESAGIKTSIQLFIPAETGRVRDSDLCVIIGSLLENAIEACKHMTEGERFIKLDSLVRRNTLTITMDNSFDGNYQEQGGVFFSRKRDGEGIGLSSVLAVTQKYGGNARFEAKGNVFMSSVYVIMREPETTQKSGGIHSASQ